MFCNVVPALFVETLRTTASYSTENPLRSFDALVFVTSPRSNVTVLPLLDTTGFSEPVYEIPESTTGAPKSCLNARPAGRLSTTIASGVVPRGMATSSLYLAISPITASVLLLYASTIEVPSRDLASSGPWIVTSVSSLRPLAKFGPPSIDA